MRILDPATEASADPLSEQILHRILSRQRTRMIADLLFCISTHPVRSYLALGGPAALHGVYLKGRAIEALDFVGRPGIALRLPELLRQTPFVFKALPEHGFFLVSRPDSAFPDIQLPVSVTWLGDDTLFDPEECVFCGEMGQAIPVRTLSLRALLSIKLSVLCQEPDPVDFFDLWCALQQDEVGFVSCLHKQGMLCDENHRVASLQQYLRLDRAMEHGFNGSVASDNLHSLRAHWEPGMKPYRTPVPTFERTAQDLEVLWTLLSPT